MPPTETTTRERPILYTAPMVRAILRGHKAQTRRIVKSPSWWRGMTHYATGNVDERGLTRTNMVLCEETATHWHYCPHGLPGDRLWVRETAYIAPPGWQDDDHVETPRDEQGRRRVVGYAATMDGEAVRCAEEYHIPKKPSIFMPRWACRLVLEITEVRVERAHDIGDGDIVAEGIAEYAAGLGLVAGDAARRRELWIHLWDAINGKRDGGKWAWARNPWTWAITFRRPEVTA